MRYTAYLAIALISLSAVAQQNLSPLEQDLDDASGNGQGRYYEGPFEVFADVDVPGVKTEPCIGTVGVYLHPGQRETFLDGQFSVGYRHNIVLPPEQRGNPLCAAVKFLSPVHEGLCKFSDPFEKKVSPVDGGRMETFRSLVVDPKDSKRYIKAPVCKVEIGKLPYHVRKPVEINTLDLSKDKSRLEFGITVGNIKIPGTNSKVPLTVTVKYHLVNVKPIPNSWDHLESGGSRTIPVQAPRGDDGDSSAGAVRE